jgi:hypothetical protein
VPNYPISAILSATCFNRIVGREPVGGNQ